MQNQFLSIWLTLLILVLTSNVYLPQEIKNPLSKTITVIPGVEYEAGWLHRFFFGEHWRDLWTLPIEVDILHLKHFAGGLTPIEKGNGFQTKSLRFKGSDGRYWKFRSLQKDPSKVLPEDLQQSVVADVVKDQISSTNPLAPLIVAPLLKAVGVLQAEPILVYLPKTDLLGEFEDEFGDLIGMLEINPSEENIISFEGAEKFLNSFKLMKRLEEKKDEKVSATDFLTARLMDVFLGDWDRHVDQWKWAKYNENGNEIWKSIPRDRDQAFSKFDGFFPTITAYYTPQLVSFKDTYSQIEDITWSGRFLDRRFLTELDFRTWDSVASFVQNKLTDEVIISAVNRIPPAHREIAGDELIHNLKKRRDNLKKASKEYYELINKYVDVYGSTKDDYTEVNRMEDRTEVKLYRKKDFEKGNYKTYYQKVFDHSITSDLRIHLLDGDDKAVVKGKVNSGIIIRVIGGDGEDELIDSSVVSGYLLSILPIYDGDIQTKFYDSGKKTKFISGSSTSIDREKYLEPRTDSEKYELQQRDRGHDWVVTPVGNYNLDDGLIIGAGLSLYSYNFRFSPFEYKQTITASYATTPKSYQINYYGLFNSFLPGADFELDILKSELNFTKYFGYGNETSFDKNLNSENYYRLGQELFQISPGLSFYLVDPLRMKVGLSYSYSNTSLANLESMINFRYQKYGLGSLRQFGITATLSIDTRDNPLHTKEGFYFDIGGSHYPAIFDITENFAQLNFDVRAYLHAPITSDVTLALKCGGGKNWGKYPFHKAIFLGGENDLRGYRRERFSGDAALFGQSELRAYVTTLKLIVKGRLGFHLFTEAGRVFTANEKSKKWHPSYGGGLWISYLQDTMNFSFTYAASPEDYSILITTGFGF